MGKNAEPSDIINNCSYETTDDKKVCDFQRYIQKLVESAIFIFCW